MTLKVVEPIEVTEAVLAASDIPEPDTAQGEVEWTTDAFIGKLVSEISDGVALTYDGNRYTVVGWNTSTLIATAYIYDSSFSFVTSKAFSSGQPYVSGDKIDVCFDGTNFWFANGDQISMYDTDWNYAGKVINTDLNFTNAYAQTICSDGAYIYLTLKDFTDTTYKIAKYEIANEAFVESKVLQTSIETKLLGGTFQNGLIKNIAKKGFDTDQIKVYTTGVDLNNFNDDGTLGSLDPTKDVGFEKTSSGYITLNPIDKRIIIYKSNYQLEGLYQPGDRVIKTSTHQVYQCLTATSQDPEEGATEDAAATWIVVGPTNKWAMFDNLQNTKTINDTDFTVTLNPVTYVNTLAVLGFSGVSSVRVEVDDTGGANIYDKTFTASDFSAIYDHYTYVFYQIVALKKLIVEDLPPLPNTTIRVTFSGSDVQIGELAFGFAVNIGTLVANGTKSDRFRYREQQYNEFGYPTGAAPIVVELNTYDVLVPKLTNPSIQKLLDGLTGKNTLWVGDIGSDQRMITYGFFERSPIPFNMPNDINYQITVRASV
jgi:hypothetical protein